MASRLTITEIKRDTMRRNNTTIRIGMNQRIHILDEDQTCGEGEDGDICIVDYGEHRPISIEEAENWRDALDKAIREVESHESR